MGARTPRLLLPLALTMALAASPARAAFDCVVTGPAGSWQVRKIQNDTERTMSLSMLLAYPAVTVTNDSNWHSFGGIWIIRPIDGGSYSFGFIDVDSTLGPPAVQVTFSGQGYLSRPVPSTDIVRDAIQGAYKVNATLRPGTYYIVGFGTGYGTWTGKLSLAGEALACPEVAVAGKTLDYDPSDFSGGTHVLVPGFGHAQGIKLSFTNPHSSLLGGLFAYEPPPFPPASVTISNEQGPSKTIRQDIIALNSTARSWSFTANYTGTPTTVLIQGLQLDLAVG